MSYGYELILDLHGCDVSKFNRTDIHRFFKELCRIIDMKRCGDSFCDDWQVPKKYRQTSPQTKGISATQYIITSSISIHCLDLLGKVFVNIFSCKNFNRHIAENFVSEFFNARSCGMHFIKRL